MNIYPVQWLRENYMFQTATPESPKPYYGKRFLVESGAREGQLVSVLAAGESGQLVDTVKWLDGSLDPAEQCVERYQIQDYFSPLVREMPEEFRESVPWVYNSARVLVYGLMLATVVVLGFSLAQFGGYEVVNFDPMIAVPVTGGILGAVALAVFALYGSVERIEASRRK